MKSQARQIEYPYRCSSCGAPGFVDVGEGKNRYPCKDHYLKMRCLDKRKNNSQEQAKAEK